MELWVSLGVLDLENSLPKNHRDTYTRMQFSEHYDFYAH